jgi:Domain of unknown function (DUF4271)
MPETLRATDPLAGDWILLVVLAALGMLGWINLVSPKKWRLLTRSFFSLRLGRQSLRDELDLQDRTLIGLTVMASASVALFAYQFAVVVGRSPAGIGLWAEIFGIAVLLLVGQVALVRLAGGLFQVEGAVEEYLYTVVLLQVVMGLCLLPLSASIAWPHRMEWRTWALWGGVGLVGLVTAFRWVRAAVLGLGEGTPLRYVFIYLCALEILPVALACQAALRLFPDPSHPF